MRPEVPLEGDVGAADRGSETGPVAGPRQRTDIGSRPAAGREGGDSRRERSDRGSAEGGSKSVDSDAQRLMSTVLTAWSQWTRSVVRPTLVADFRPTPLSLLATEPKAEWPWSPKQSFTAGHRPDGNVCRAELNEVEVAQARRAGAAGTKPFFWSFSGGRRA